MVLAILQIRPAIQSLKSKFVFQAQPAEVLMVFACRLVGCWLDQIMIFFLLKLVGLVGFRQFTQVHTIPARLATTGDRVVDEAVLANSCDFKV